MSNPTNGLDFGQFVPGFEFLQNLVNPAAPGPSMGMPNLGSWVAPTFNVEDLEKRIDELKTVHFWLEQNSKALGATIQAMEVQKMTLATLRDLNVNFSDIAKAGEAASSAAAAVSNGFAGGGPTAPDGENAEPAKAVGADSGQVDSVQWWGALQQQFQNIAVNALQNLTQQAPPVAVKKTAGVKPTAKTPAKVKPIAKKVAPRKKAPVRTKPR